MSKLKTLDDLIDAIAAVVDHEEDLNSAHYKLLHKLRDLVQIERADPNEYYDSQLGVVEDILSRAIQNMNARKNSGRHER